MLWSNIIPKTRMTSLQMGIFACVLTLGGCLRPLYGALDGNLRQELQAIRVEPIADRVGHFLGNDLIFALNGTGSEVTPKYRLVVTVSESVQAALVDAFAGRASSATVVAKATYQLLPIAGGTALAEGTAISSASYDRTAQRFGSVRAARDAEIRVAQTLSDQIRIRISAALSAPK